MAEAVSGEREKQILSAARNVFARYGFYKTTMEDISVEVEMGKASLYYYFPTKESLFSAVVSQERDEFMNNIEINISKESSSAGKLKTYVDERLNFFRNLVNLGMLSNHIFLEGRSLHQKLSDEFALKEMKVIEKIISEGITTGEFKRNIKAQELSVLLIHLLQGLRLRTVKKGPNIENKAYEKLRREMLMTIEILLQAIISN